MIIPIYISLLHGYFFSAPQSALSQQIRFPSDLARRASDFAALLGHRASVVFLKSWHTTSAWLAVGVRIAEFREHDIACAHAARRIERGDCSGESWRVGWCHGCGGGGWQAQE